MAQANCTPSLLAQGEQEQDSGAKQCWDGHPSQKAQWSPAAAPGMKRKAESGSAAADEPATENGAAGQSQPSMPTGLELRQELQLELLQPACLDPDPGEAGGLQIGNDSNEALARGEARSPRQHVAPPLEAPWCSEVVHGPVAVPSFSSPKRLCLPTHVPTPPLRLTPAMQLLFAPAPPSMAALERDSYRPESGTISGPELFASMNPQYLQPAAATHVLWPITFGLGIQQQQQALPLGMWPVGQPRSMPQLVPLLLQPIPAPQLFMQLGVAQQLQQTANSAPGVESMESLQQHGRQQLSLTAAGGAGVAPNCPSSGGAGSASHLPEAVSGGSIGYTTSGIAAECAGTSPWPDGGGRGQPQLQPPPHQAERQVEEARGLPVTQPQLPHSPAPPVATLNDGNNQLESSGADGDSAGASRRSGARLPTFKFVVRPGQEVLDGARAQELPGVQQVLEEHEMLARDILEGVLCLAEQEVEAGDKELTALLERLGIDEENLQGLPEGGLHREPGAPCALLLRTMLSLAVSGMEGGLLHADARRSALEQQGADLRQCLRSGGQRSKQHSPRPAVGDGSKPSLSERLQAVEAAMRRLPKPSCDASPTMSNKVAANFLALRQRMAATPHAELQSMASSQAEVAEQLRQCGALEGREWVQVQLAQVRPEASTGNSKPGGSPCCAGTERAALLLGRGTGGGYMPLLDGRCTVTCSDGQQIFAAQPTNARCAVAMGRAHLLLLQRMMGEHAQLLQLPGNVGEGQGGCEPWSPSNPAHQALYWLALGMTMLRRQACASRVGYYHSEIQLHSAEVVSHLGGQRHPSLAAATAPACSGWGMHQAGYNQSLTLDADEGQAGIDPGAWPWQNTTAWSLTDQLSGPPLRAMEEAAAAGNNHMQLPILPGINTGFAIVTAAASLAVHVEDFCGGSTNMCWAGSKLWLFVPSTVLEKRKRHLASKLMGKQIPPEWLLADEEVLKHVQLALQLPGQLMVIKPGKAYHGVSVPGFCLAEASNHWTQLEARNGAPGVEFWLAEWCDLKQHCSGAWAARMRPLWFFFNQLGSMLRSAMQQQAGMLDSVGATTARAIGRLLQMDV